jgi:hypothetical protein
MASRDALRSNRLHLAVDYQAPEDLEATVVIVHSSVIKGMVDENS